MSRNRLRRIALLLAAALAVVFPARAEDPSPAKPKLGENANPPAAKPKVPFTISRETTYIVAPLDKDGYPDYIAAINQHCRKGVTPENNSAVLFWRAMGPSEIFTQRRAEYFKQLGIDPLPEKGDYFVTSEQYAKRLNGAERTPGQKAGESTGDAFLNALAKAAKRPWPKQEFPQVAAWLEVNEKPLALLIEASKRPRRFDPLVGGKSGILLSVMVPAFTAYREAGRGLAARAMLRLNDGRVDDAWQDLLACHRLARLVAEGPSLEDFFVGGTLENSAFSAEQGMLQQQRLSTEQALKMRDDLDRLPAISRISDSIDIGERYIYLDNVGHMARGGARWLNQFAQYSGFGADSPEQKAYWKAVYDAAAAGPVDWDSILRLGNASCDRVVDSMRKATRAERKAAGDEMDLRIRKNMAETQAILRTGLGKSADQRKVVSEALGHILCGLFLSSGLRAAADVEDRGLMRFDLTKLAFALAAYRTDHQAYPAKLADLAPKYIAQIPKDRFNDGDLHYSPQGGYLLYSVGPNGKDDGGKGIEDRKRGEPWDDIAIRISKP